MVKQNDAVKHGMAKQIFGSITERSVRCFPIAAALIIVATMTFSSAMGGSPSVKLSEIDLLKLQVFAKHSIHAAKSDYQGATAAGGDIDLSDFAIGGDLTSGKYIVFQKGKVEGLISSPARNVTSVFSSGSGSVRQDAMEIASLKLDLLSARLSALPQTSRFEMGVGATGNQEFKASVKHDIEVVDLNGDRLVAAGSSGTRLVLSGDRDGLLLIRMHGRFVHLRHIGFSVEGSLDPSKIIYFFPEAYNLEISESGSASTDNRRSWNIPGSVIAPDASIDFSSSTITGRLFVDSITSAPGLPSGQVDRLFTTRSDRFGIIQEDSSPFKLLELISGKDFSMIYSDHILEQGLGDQAATGCQLICARSGTSWSDPQRTR